MNDILLAPRRTLGRYEIIDEIAQGAMGVVYKARDPLIDRVVAIKTVGLGLSSAETEAYERRFFREAKSAGRLNHPNVVTIHDVGRADDVAYIAMEFLDGQSLRDLMDSGVVLPPQRVADIAAEIAEGLAFAHDNGVVHRDVKPANIMVLASGAVKITDFGIALLPTGTRTLAGNAFGSPRYTSPEQVMGRSVDGRSDIFSLGATVYEMLTGAPPFTGGDLNTILKQVLSDPTPPPSSVNPSLPRAFDHIVGKALAKDPADRYQTAEEMAHDLRAFDALELGTAAPPPLPALEHATATFSVRDLSRRIAEPVAPLVADPEASSLAPPPVAPLPWWRRRSAAFAALGVLGVVIAVALGMGLRQGKAPMDTVAGPASVPATGGSVDPSRAVAGATAAASAPAAPETPAASGATPPTGGFPMPAPAAAAEVASGPLAPPASSEAKGDPGSATRVAGATEAASVAPAAAPDAAVAPAAATPAGPAATAHPPPPPPKPTGRVTFAVAPWGEIYVDGRRRGIAPPLQELKLPPGKHVIEVRNATFPAFNETIELEANAVIRIRHKFQ